jgi:hypothetical protein
MPVAFRPGRLNHERVFGSEVPRLWEHWLESIMSSAGPLWFVWILMIFSVLASVWYRYRPEMGEWLRRRASRTFEGPWRFFGLLLDVSFAAYLPMAVVLGEGRWISLGPFDFQVSRVLLYLTYFAFGVAVGAYGHDRAFLKSDGPLARRWWLWALLALVLSAASLFMDPAGLPLGCAFLVFAAIAVFVRFATCRIGVLDNLSENAYGIYLLHYLFVGWLQWGLYDSGIPVPTQGLLVFVGTVALSWGVTAALRCISAVARVV